MHSSASALHRLQLLSTARVQQQAETTVLAPALDVYTTQLWQGVL
jgi:hypothetical protein